MRLLPLVALAGLVACGGQSDDRVAVAPPSASHTSDAGEAHVTDDEVRRGCVSFTKVVDSQHSNEVYDPRSGVLSVHVAEQRYLLSKAMQECRDNPIAMERLRQAEQVERENNSG